MEDLFSGFDDIYASDTDWWEDPLTFKEFVESPEHLNQKLTPVQYSWFTSLVGIDPKEIFRRPVVKHIMAILAGKGSGKDLSTSAFFDYILYVLLCMNSPTAYFNLSGEEEAIDIVNCSQSQTQSIRVFFKRFTTRLKRWPWLRKHFLLMDHKKPLNPDIINPRDTINILDASLTCDKSPVRFWSLHSGSQSYEGLNVLVGCIDEGGAFPNYSYYDKDGREIVRSRADDMLDVLSSSAQSRNWNWYIFLISYPRSSNCFAMRTYLEGQKKDSQIMSVRYSQFECLPKEKYSGNWVEWEGLRIPEEFLRTAKKDPADFKLKYFCIADSSIQKFFNPKYVDDIFTPDLHFIGNFKDYIETAPTGRTYIYKRLESWEQTKHDFNFVLAGDYSTVNDRTSVMLAHGVNIEQTSEALKGLDTMVVIDLILMWQPDKKKCILVSHGSIHECIKEILYHCNIIAASLDQLESALSLEKLNLQGIPADKHNINDNDYIRTRNLVDAGLIKSPIYPLLRDEFYNVQYFPNRRRVDHTSDGSKDVLDTLCQCCRLVYSHKDFSNVQMTIGENPFSMDEKENTTLSIDNWAHLIPGLI